jgi:PGF-CTERM protein
VEPTPTATTVAALTTAPTAEQPPVTRPEDDDQPTTTTEGPGMGVLVALVALLTLGALVRRRR